MTKIKDLSNEIMNNLEEYKDLTIVDMKEVVKKVANEVTENIKEKAPVKTGAYKKSWTCKKTKETANSLQMTVYSKNRIKTSCKNCRKSTSKNNNSCSFIFKNNS